MLDARKSLLSKVRDRDAQTEERTNGQTQWPLAKSHSKERTDTISSYARDRRSSREEVCRG